MYQCTSQAEDRFFPSHHLGCCNPKEERGARSLVGTKGMTGLLTRFFFQFPKANRPTPTRHHQEVILSAGAFGGCSRSAENALHDPLFWFDLFLPLGRRSWAALFFEDSEYFFSRAGCMTHR